MCKCGVFLGYLRKNQDASGTGAVGIAEGEGERVDTFREVIGPQIIYSLENHCKNFVFHSEVEGCQSVLIWGVIHVEKRMKNDNTETEDLEKADGNHPDGDASGFN